MDIASISSFLSSVDLTVNLIKNSIDKIKDDAVREHVAKLFDAVIPLQTTIMSLQEMNRTCIKEKETLEKKLIEIENWNKDASSYRLNELASGVYVYSQQESAEISRPYHHLCAKCFNDRKISILQRTHESISGVHYICHNCSSRILDHSKSIEIKQQPPDSNMI